jgi:hypothetical protein
MTSEITISAVPAKLVTARPLVTSYDSGYEHSLEHLIEVRMLLEQADEEIPVIPDWYHATA